MDSHYLTTGAHETYFGIKTGPLANVTVVRIVYKGHLLHEGCLSVLFCIGKQVSKVHLGISTRLTSVNRVS